MKYWHILIVGDDNARSSHGASPGAPAPATTVVQVRTAAATLAAAPWLVSTSVVGPLTGGAREAGLLRAVAFAAAAKHGLDCRTEVVGTRLVVMFECASGARDDEASDGGLAGWLRRVLGWC